MTISSTFRVPKTVGGIADRLFRLRTQRLDIEKAVKKLKAEEAVLRAAGLAALNKVRAESARGKLGTITVKRVEVPTVEDWTAFHAYIKKSGAFDLLQRRPAIQACRDRWEEGEALPGVVRTPVVDVTLTKAKRA